MLNGYIGQGIDEDWNLTCIPFALQPITGSHTGVAIKEQYDLITKKFGIDDKVFKLVGDSASNNKKAFKHQTESSK